MATAWLASAEPGEAAVSEVVEVVYEKFRGFEFVGENGVALSGGASGEIDEGAPRIADFCEEGGGDFAHDGDAPNRVREMGGKCGFGFDEIVFGSEVYGFKSMFFEVLVEALVNMAEEVALVGQF